MPTQILGHSPVRWILPSGRYEARGAGLFGASHSWEDRTVDDRVVRTSEPDPAQLAVENERLQSVLRARLEEEHALRRVATCVAQGRAPAAVLTLVTEEVVRHLSADMAVT